MASAKPDLDAIFGALADPVRRAIVVRLANGEASVGELAEPFAISLPAISRHLRVLEEASLIKRTTHGRHRRCNLRREPLALACGWLGQYQEFWGGSFDRLQAFLDEK